MQDTKQLFTDYNRINTGKAWAIVAGTNEDGAIYCPACLDRWGVPVDSKDYSPVFASDGDFIAGGFNCFTCQKKITN